MVRAILRFDTSNDDIGKLAEIHLPSLPNNLFISAIVEAEPEKGDLISRKALKEAIEQEHQRVLKISPICSSISLNMLNKIIDNAPTVDAIVNTIEVRPQGEWSKTDNRWGMGLWRCSYCNSFYDVKTNYCPTCGAKMKGEAE